MKANDKSGTCEFIAVCVMVIPLSVLMMTGLINYLENTKIPIIPLSAGYLVVSVLFILYILLVGILYDLLTSKSMSDTRASVLCLDVIAGLFLLSIAAAFVLASMKISWYS